MTGSAGRSLLLLALPGLIVLSGAPAASAADPAASCGLRVLSTSAVDGQAPLLVSAPPPPARTASSPRSFQLEQSGSRRPVTATALPEADLAVVVVLASSTSTSAEALQEGRAAAFELLSSLPATARTALLATGVPQPLAELSTQRGESTEALRTVLPSPDETAASATARAAALLPPGGHVVLVADEPPSAEAAQVDPLPSRGPVVHRIRYTPAPGAARPEPTDACPDESSPVLRQVIAVVAGLRGQYRVQAQRDPYAAATLTVTDGGRSSQALVPPSRAAAEALVDPYAQSGRRSVPPALGFGLTGLLGLAGVALLRRRPVQRRTDPPPGAGRGSAASAWPAPDDAAAPLRRDERTGAGRSR